MDSFFNKGFKAPKCKTLLKLTIPRIKLLRNRREIQIKQMRRDIAKLLETGQEATARIRVEHIIREEKMMAAQEIIELFCELIAVRLPIIEAQRECPLDLKEAISSVCFAAPRCADLTELMQVQMLFAGKYGKEFVSAATELMPECGVNRQVVELLSIRAPSPDVKLKLLKEIAQEHELDWDPADSETELLKPHEDLLNGPSQCDTGSRLRLPKEKHDDSTFSTVVQPTDEESDAGFDTSDFPEVPKASLRPGKGTVSAPEMLPFPASALSEVNRESEETPEADESLDIHDHPLKPEEVVQEKSVTKEECEAPNVSASPTEKQFLPFTSPPSLSSASFSVGQNMKRDNPPPSVSRTRSVANVDLQDVLAAAQAAAESAERAAAAARSAASLAQLRITELVEKNNDEAIEDGIENPFHSGISDNPHIHHQNSSGDSDDILRSPSPHLDHGNQSRQASDLPPYDNSKVDFDSSLASTNIGQETAFHQPRRLSSVDDETYLSYPNLFTRQDSNPGLRAHSTTDNSRTSGI